MLVAHLSLTEFSPGGIKSDFSPTFPYQPYGCRAHRPRLPRLPLVVLTTAIYAPIAALAGGAGACSMLARTLTSHHLVTLDSSPISSAFRGVGRGTTSQTTVSGSTMASAWSFQDRSVLLAQGIPP